MKALTCEMCGSTNIIKQDGLYVCQSCGTKYSLEEAKKMMVEGSVSIKGKVQIDKSFDITNLRQLAKRARHNDEKAKALKYYDRILESNANDTEACFFSSYYGVLANLESYFPSDIESSATAIADSIFPLLSNIKETISDEQAQYDEVAELQQYVISLAETLYDYVCKSSGFSSHGIASAKDSIRDIVYKFGDAAFEIFADAELAIPAWMFGVESITDDGDENREIYAGKIAKHQEGYVPSKNGCYIATAVYGSYNCPEVWTLRRFRDYSLAKVWYGRAFIQTYYAISPTLVKWFGHTEWFKSLWRTPLNKLVARLRTNGVSCAPYRDKNYK